MPIEKKKQKYIQKFSNENDVTRPRYISGKLDDCLITIELLQRMFVEKLSNAY